MKTFALIALLGVTSGFRLGHKFATGASGDEDLGQNIIMKGDKFHYNQNLGQSTANAAAQEGSGVRARWVELPDCKSSQHLALPDIALREDLSNAIIATCKSWKGVYTTPTAPAIDTSTVYDAVIHANVVIPDIEH